MVADPDAIEDAMTLAGDVEWRIKMQAFLQEYVDHGISSTSNLPAWGTPGNNEGTVTQFGETLLKYLPKLRGLTCYPNGAREGQPLVRVPWAEAVRRGGEVFSDGGCKDGVCAS